MAMQKSRPARRDTNVARIRDVLLTKYLPSHPDAQVDVRRYNRHSVRVRVIDKSFTGVLITRRDGEIWPLLCQHLGEEELGEITLLLLLAPGEESTSLMNQEFENPTPSLL